ncbi:MAG: T9SS type A sorting domain-containing protein [Paludibacteraceae bacterium]|jgi:hypothetical protein|nr:T9SS type A sorting domain-containing protein [Paludibacteraceae bacterium]
MRKKIFGTILFSAMCLFMAQAATVITIMDKNGGSKEYNVSDSGKLYFTDNALMINEQAGSKDVSVDISSIRKIMFKPGSVGVGANAADAIALVAFPNPAKDVLFLAGVDNGSKVSVYAANGALVKEYSYSDEGINVSSLPSGSYMITVSGKSVKFNKL